MDSTQIGGYQLGKCLGTGATATVHIGAHPERGQVALKVLHPDLVDNPELVERFRREARTLKGLKHGNIVGFIDFIEEPPNYVFVMELLDGGTLETYLTAKRTVRDDRALSWTTQLAVALAVAHDASVVHRDLKPANIFLTTQGRVVLSDFGLARPEHDKVTRAGTKMMGTPLYMAPEQILGRTATPATDVYQLGLVLYEMLLGHRAFPREDAYSQMMARLDEDLFVPLDVEVAPHFREIIRRAGFRDPERRYPSGRALLKDLQAAKEGRRLPFVPPAPGLPRKATLTTQGLDWRNPDHYQGTMLVCPQVNLRYDPQGKAFFVGSDQAAQVYLEAREIPIAPRQLRIAPYDGAWRAETGNFQADVVVDGEALRADSVELRSGSMLEIGGYELLWVDHGDAEAADEAPGQTMAASLPAASPPSAPAAKGAGCAGVLLLGVAPVLGLLGAWVVAGALG